MTNWYKLDNAAKIFPPTFSRSEPANFRLSAIFYEDIKKEVLKEALEISLKRFPLFNVVLKKGLFWYYLEKTNKEINVYEEKHLYQSIDINKLEDFLFNVFYYEKRICLEIWHGLTDANGGMEFLKSICFNYLNLLNVKIENNDTILTNDMLFNESEYEDSFVVNYKKEIKKSPKAVSSYMIKGNYMDDTKVFQGLLSIIKTKEIAKKYDATISEYIGGVLLYSVYQTYKNDNKENKPFILFIPVNARKYFDSKTLKNFMLYIRTTLDESCDVTLENTINCIKNSLRKELTVDFLNSVIKSNVNVEKNKLIKLTPIGIKNFVMNLGYKLVGRGKATIVLSNIGVVQTPDEMKKHIERFEFGISPSRALPKTFAVASYDDKLVITFSNRLDNDLLIKCFFDNLSKENDVVINSNVENCLISNNNKVTYKKLDKPLNKDFNEKKCCLTLNILCIITLFLNILLFRYIGVIFFVHICLILLILKKILKTNLSYNIISYQMIILLMSHLLDMNISLQITFNYIIPIMIICSLLLNISNKCYKNCFKSILVNIIFSFLPILLFLIGLNVNIISAITCIGCGLISLIVCLTKKETYKEIKKVFHM